MISSKSLIWFLILEIFLIQCIHSAKVCTKYWVRKEWRELTQGEISDFLSAVKCLKDKPSKYDPSLGSTSIYDDMVYIHIFANDVAHKVAAFLPWHRQFLSIFENLLRKECKYMGSMPYWDFSMDSQAPENSPVFWKDAYGGNGGPNGCIVDGVFTNWSSTFPEKKPCITRQFNMNSQYGHLMGAQYSPLQIEYMLLYYKNFYEFEKVIEEHPHNMAHYGIGGTMFDPKTAANDPIFWIIHTNIDRIWYTWQKRYPELANTFNGNRIPNSTVQDASPDDMLRFYGLGDDIKVRDTFSTESMRYCYVYSNSIMPIKTGTVSKRSFNFGSIVSKFKKSPGPYDRANIYQMHYPISFPERFLKKKYSAEKVIEIREREKIFNSLVDLANERNYVSPSALIYSKSSVRSANVQDMVELSSRMNPVLNFLKLSKDKLKSFKSRIDQKLHQLADKIL